LPAEIEVTGQANLVPLDRIPGYQERYAVGPGLTGLAPDTSRRLSFGYDVLYIIQQSFWLDLRLVALFFWITFQGK